ncbi:MAG: AAA family ATPase [Patescibacteria group bacterium]|jgi:ATP-dependent Clp protease ATP-binding subunit ClpC|nr:ATP-dependent Clp protease ATP-binding subunit [bacterium]HQC49887.1 ATP-dependent Clp protease ATP-binding subunit [bacterium]
MAAKFEKIEKEKLDFIKDNAGPGQGAWFLGRFLFWDKTIKRSLIALEKTQRQFNKLLGIFSWIIIFAGWAAFFAWIYLHKASLQLEPLNLFFFWTKPHLLITFFLLSLWFDLFLFYKASSAAASKKRINYKLFQDDKNKQEVRRYNVARSFSEDTWRVVEDAFLLAKKLGKKQANIIHFFRAALKNKEVQTLFIRLDVDATKLVAMVDRQLAKEIGQEETGHGAIADSLQEVFISAFTDAYYRQQKSVDILNVILFCAEKDENLAEILYELEVDADKIINTISWFRVSKKLSDRYHEYRKLAFFKPGTGMNRSYTAIATPTLDYFSHDLTLRAKAGSLDLCVGREKEIDSIFEAFSAGYNGVLLVGPVGVGKTSIVGGLAQLMVEENVPDFLKDKRLVEIDVSRLVSGAGPAIAEERLLSSINEAARSGNIIFYIDNIENLIGISAGSQESLDLSEVLAEAISRQKIMCISSVTSENYHRYVENRAIGTVMNMINIAEPDTNSAIQILESRVGFLEAKYDIYIVYSALEQAVKMADRYLKDKFLPLKAINLLEKAAIIAAKNSRNNPENAFCSGEEVALAVEEMTGIPANKVSAEESAKLLNLEEEIKQRLVGQEEAVKAVASSLRRARAAFKDSQKPIASFLFLGPTGVGKTELAKSVSEVYFGSEEYMIRLDMSEYQHQDSVHKMIGDVDGTLGYLTEAVRKKPFSLILLDEIEKADSNILNLFLQLLDDGRLTDGQGRTISFSESIIIATSNIGANFIQDQIKAKAELNVIKQELIDNYLREKMRPELINRFDGIIVFRPLVEAEIFKIATLMLKKIKKSLANQGIGLKADKDGVAILARQGHDPKFGARPLRRLLQEKVEDEIANKILSGELKRRDQVLIDNQAKIIIEKASQL